MFKFDMSIAQNFAFFTDNEKVVLVDTFDHQHFDVRYGTAEETKPLGTIIAYTSEELNAKLAQLVG